MKKTLLFAAILSCIAISMFSCSHNNNEIKVPPHPTIENPATGDVYTVDTTTIDECQYICVYGPSGNFQMFHKGVCHNPIHNEGIDKPEEWEAISNDKKNPSILVGYKDSVTGVVHIEYMPDPAKE